jgi:hypothetical protein
MVFHGATQPGGTSNIAQAILSLMKIRRRNTGLCFAYGGVIWYRAVLYYTPKQRFGEDATGVDNETDCHRLHGAFAQRLLVSRA